jgi:peptide/nickel transport system substrate-binding protein
MKASFRTSILAALVLVSLVALLAACGPTATPVPTEVAAPPTEAPTEPPPTEAPEPKELTIGATVDMTNFDFTYALDQGTRSVTLNMNDPFFRAGEAVLIDSYEMIDPSTWEFTLKEGIEFHNGMPLTAEDVKFTMEFIADPERDPVSIIASRLAHIDSVEVIDDLTFRVHTSRPDVILPRSVMIHFGPVPKAYYEENDLEYINENPVGVGPFKFVEWVKDSHVTLEANEDYWGELPKIDKVTYRIIPETGARMAALRAGEIDIAMWIPPEEIERLESEGFTVHKVPIERTVIVAFNQAVCEPCKDLKVREAMIYAVDREATVDEILIGLGEVVPTLISPDNLGYNEDLEVMPYDPEKAKELLAEAGYPDGFELTFFATEGRMTKDKEVAQAIAAYLGEVGIDVTLQTMQFQEFIQIKNAVELPELWMIGWAAGNRDGYSNSYWVLTSDATAWAEQLVADPDQDVLINASASALTEEERAAKLREVLQHAYDQAYFMPMYRYLDSIATSSRVINWTPPADELVTVGVETDVTE